MLIVNAPSCRYCGERLERPSITTDSGRTVYGSWRSSDGTSRCSKAPGVTGDPLKAHAVNPLNGDDRA